MPLRAILAATICAALPTVITVAKAVAGAVPNHIARLHRVRISAATAPALAFAIFALATTLASLLAALLRVRLAECLSTLAATCSQRCRSRLLVWIYDRAALYTGGLQVCNRTPGTFVFAAPSATAATAAAGDSSGLCSLPALVILPTVVASGVCCLSKCGCIARAMPVVPVMGAGLSLLCGHSCTSLVRTPPGLTLAETVLSLHSLVAPASYVPAAALPGIPA